LARLQEHLGGRVHEVGDLLDGLEPVVRRADYFQVRLGAEQQAQAAPKDRMIVRWHHTDRPVGRSGAGLDLLRVYSGRLPVARPRSNGVEMPG
jgi:hypothetical protein